MQQNGQTHSHPVRNVILGIVLVSVGIAIGLGASSLFAVPTLLRTPEPWVAIATFLLVGVTGYYAIETRRTVEAIRKSAEAQFLPHVKMWISMLGPTYFLLEIGNVGPGSAQNVTVKFHTKEFEGSDRTWTTPLLSPQESHQFWIPIGPNKKDALEEPFKFFQTNQGTVEMEASFRDILEKDHHSSAQLDITAWAKQFGNMGVVWEREDLRLIREELESIKETLRPISRVAEEIDRTWLVDLAKKMRGEKDQEKKGS